MIASEFTFDAEFLTRLRQRDAATCTRFVFFFTPMLEAKLRYAFKNHAAVEDVRNETLYRVIQLVDREQVREPERFGAFVRGVCGKVTQEYRKDNSRVQGLTPDSPEPRDERPLIEDLLNDEELRTILKDELSKLGEEDRKLIEKIYLEQRNRREMALELGVSPGGLNVRLHRAVKHLKSRISGSFARSNELK